ncbi:uncharacterized protein [Blastocystis hominis]|uniref:Uncharacterized protein n=1 Tax=Blastocystis hominis TaxID=12968 RepID=D8M5N4_BLAHO|nr:uncharacterized protein [Blastocystis hominis]CBK23373.2 unnamed protein product [Blastocystis hominis]|eukprot:XP_012897421.1 uncharacterized protein [Blastocystis hominis]
MYESSNGMSVNQSVSEHCWYFPHAHDSLDPCFDLYLSGQSHRDSYSSLSHVCDLFRHYGLPASLLEIDVRSVVECSFYHHVLCVCLSVSVCAFEQKGDSRCRGPSEEVYRECSEGIAQYSSWHWLFQQIPGEGRKTRIACLL